LDFHLFRSGTWPSKDFEADLENLARLPQRDLDRLRNWFVTTRTFTSLDWPDYAEGVKKSDLSVEEFEKHVSVIQYVLNRWNAEKLSVAQVTSDLPKFGLKPRAVSKLAKLFGSLEKVGRRVYLDSIRSFHENVALPTIDDINVVCELRPLFGDPAYEAPPMGAEYDKLFGFTEVMLLEIVASDSRGGETSATYQLTERDFDNLLQGLTRARRQFEVMKTWKAQADKITMKGRAVNP